MLLLHLSGATTVETLVTPDEHLSGESAIIVGSSDLGRKGRVGETAVIFTAGMVDLRGLISFLEFKKGK